MGRLPTLTLGLVLAITGCNDEKKREPRATGQRSQSVVATGPVQAPTAPATQSAPVQAPKKPRVLCAGQLDKPGRELPQKKVSRAAAPGAGALPEKLAPRGTWTWINFWAAWCAPCKEEMPRLVGWKKKLQAAGKHFDVVFVSLDDDQRQLDEFLEKQPAGGVRASYWLAEGDERTEWLEAAEIEADPELPTHLLVDPQGQVRCRVKGAVEDRDFASLGAIVDR